MNTKKIIIGALLLAVSSAVLFAQGPVDSAVPVVLASLAALGMAAGALLVGTSNEGRPV